MKSFQFISGLIYLFFCSCQQETNRDNGLSGSYARVVVEIYSNDVPDKSILKKTIVDGHILKMTDSFINNDSIFYIILDSLKLNHDKIEAIRGNIKLTELKKEKIIIDYYSSDENKALIYLNELMKHYINYINYLNSDFVYKKQQEINEEGWTLSSYLENMDEDIEKTVPDYFFASFFVKESKDELKYRREIFNELKDAILADSISLLKIVSDKVTKNYDQVINTWLPHLIKAMESLEKKKSDFYFEEMQRRSKSILLFYIYNSLKGIDRFIILKEKHGNNITLIIKDGNENRIKELDSVAKLYLKHMERQAYFEMNRLKIMEGATILSGPFFIRK